MKTSHANSIADSQEIFQFNDSILSWYKVNARELPWRAKHNARANPYHVWLSEIMLQQTTVAAVTPYFKKFIARWPNVKSLAKADSKDVMDMWAGLGYYSRARNLHKCAQQIVDLYDGKIPSEETSLLGLAGIGAYTAGAIGSIAFNLPRLTIDGNIERIFARYYNVQDYMPEAKKVLRALIEPYMCNNSLNQNPSSYVQALMDLGSSICQPKKVQCLACPLSSSCEAHKRGNALDLPRKRKKLKPIREALCFIVYDKGGSKILLERRPDKGLLGRMLGFPTTRLSSSGKSQDELIKFKSLIDKNCFVEHVFTHFRLKLYVAKVDVEYFNRMGLSDKIDSYWVDCGDIGNIQMPTLFSKARSVI